MVRYIGIKKHKSWTPNGAFGSMCPSDTHMVNGRHFSSTEPEHWNKWPDTLAQKLLDNSVTYENQRYAAYNGIAYCGQESTDESWHGYPIPWRDVPIKVRDALEELNQVTGIEVRRGLKKQKHVDPKRDLDWAL